MAELVLWTIFFVVLFAVNGCFDKPIASVRGFIYWVSGEEKRDRERRASGGNGTDNVKTGSGSSSYGEFTPIDTAPGWETSVGIFGTDGHGDGYGYYGGSYGDGHHGGGFGDGE